MEQFFVTNDIPNSNKAAIFLSATGVRAYELLQNLLALDLPKNKQFNKLALFSLEAKTRSDTSSTSKHNGKTKVWQITL